MANDAFRPEPLHFTSNNQFPHSLDFSMDPLDPTDPILLGLQLPQQPHFNSEEPEPHLQYGECTYRMALSDTPIHNVSDDEQKVLEAFAVIAAAQQIIDNNNMDQPINDSYSSYSNGRNNSSLESSNNQFVSLEQTSKSHQFNTFTVQQPPHQSLSYLDFLSILKF